VLDGRGVGPAELAWAQQRGRATHEELGDASDCRATATVERQRLSSDSDCRATATVERQRLSSADATCSARCGSPAGKEAYLAQHPLAQRGPLREGLEPLREGLPRAPYQATRLCDPIKLPVHVTLSSYPPVHVDGGRVASQGGQGAVVPTILTTVSFFFFFNLFIDLR